ncbi:MAG: CARDB domain-containing protein, partial [Candidatus Aenigmatarchaeota archaeon]
PEEEFKEWKCHEDGEWKSCDDVRWDEDIDINGNEAEVKMWDDRNVTAVFEREGVEEMNKLLVKLDGGGRISPDYDADGYIESCEDDEYADDYYDYCWWYVEESEAEIEAIGSGWTVVNLVGHRWRGREDYEWKDYGLLDWLYPANSDFEEFGVDMAGERRVRVAQHPQLEVDIYPDDVEDDVDVSVDGMEDCEPDKYDECWVMEHEIVAEPDLDYDEDKLELVGWEGEVTTSTPEGPASYFDDCENDDVDEWLDCDTGEVDTDKPRKVQAEFELSGDGTMEVKAEPEEGGDVDVEWEEEGETVQETVADEDTFTVMEGTDVDLEAKSATDWDFVEWQGDSDIQGDTSKNVQLTINPDHEATAVFETGDPYFDVDITDPQDGDEFEEGDTVTVDYEVGNVGGEDGTQDIEFKVDGTLEDTEEDVSISSGDTYTDSFTWTPGSEGDHTLSVHSDDDSDDVTVGVIDPGDPYFDVDITDPQDGDEFEEGDTVTVDYEVGNVGGEDGTQDIEFKVDGTLEDTEEDVSISSGDTYTDSFTWTPGSEGDHTLSVHSDDDSDDVTVGVIDPGDPYFDVDITDPQDGDEFEEGDTVTVDYEVGNVGGEDGTQDIEFKVDGTLEDTEEDVSISSGDTYTDSFTWTPGSEGDHTLSVHSDDDSDDVTVGIDGGTTESDHCEVRVCGPGGACDTITVEC